MPSVRICLAFSLLLLTSSGCVTDIALYRADGTQLLVHNSLLRRGTYDHATSDATLQGTDEAVSGGAVLLGAAAGSLLGPAGTVTGGLAGLLTELFGGGREYEAAVVGEAAEAISGEGSALVVPDVSGSGGLIPPAPPTP